MRAIRLHRHGEPVTLEDIPEPIVAPGELLVDLRYVGINPLDVIITLGRVAADAPLPRTPGVEGSGFLNGKAVLVHGAAVGVRRDGTLAERVTAPPIAVVPIPDGVPLEVAAACGITGATAIRVAELAEAHRGDRVLVLAAAGAVGMAVCSILAADGIDVWGQVRREDAVTAVRSMGAKPLVISEPDKLSAAMHGEKPIAVIDCLGGMWTAAAESTLEYGGRHVVFGASAGVTVELNLLSFYRRGGVLRGYAGMLEPPERLRGAVEAALLAVASGRMRIPLGTVMPLGAAADALTAATQTHVGKIIVSVRE
jgi:NADPH2:quinone reductase